MPATEAGPATRQLSQLSPAAVHTYSALLSVLGGIRPNGDWIDVGCGDLTFSWIAEGALGMSITGFDRILRPRASQRSGQVISDAGRLPVADSSIRVLVSNFLLEHLDEPSAFLSEVKRVLRHDGIALISVNGPDWHVARMLRFLLEEVPRRPKKMLAFLQAPLRYLAHEREWAIESKRPPKSVLEEARDWSPDRWSTLFAKSGLAIDDSFRSAGVFSLISYSFRRKRNTLHPQPKSDGGIHLTYVLSKEKAGSQHG